MKKKRWIIWIVLGLLLLLGAAGLTVYNLREDRNGGAESAAAMDDLAAVLEEVPLRTVTTRAELERAQVESGEVPGLQAPMETTVYDSHTYAAVITIPSLEIQLPVQYEWSYPNLRISPCRLTGSPETEDLVILAHNYRSHFGRLGNVKPGAEVSVTLVDGMTYVYYVDAIEVVEPTAVKDVTSGEWPLTLFTCTASGRTRLVVRCDMADE